MNKKAKIATIAILILVGVFTIGLVVAHHKPGHGGGGNGGNESGGAKECNDNLDNDGDGAIDLADAGCRNKGDNDETNCGDGVCEGGETAASCQADCAPPP